MPDGLYRADTLSPSEFEELEEDLVAFCDRALDLLGGISGRRVLYAGGAAPLWLEGLAERIGAGGSLTALDSDAERAEEGRRWIHESEPPCPVGVVEGDVFSPPFTPGSFDLVYSAGLLHELDVGASPVEEAVQALAATLTPGGRLATEDFVDDEPAAQLEEEALEDELRRGLSGEEPFGIGPSGRMISLHRGILDAVDWRVLPPFGLRHLDRLFLAQGEPQALAELPRSTGDSLRSRWRELSERVRGEGYTRPATLYVEGRRTR